MDYFKIWLILISCLAASLGVRAQGTEIPAEKKETIRKILIATKAVENKREAFEYSLKDFEGLYSMLAATAVRLNDSRSVKDQIEQKKLSFKKRFNERLNSLIDFDEYVQSTYYELYDKQFTETDLKELLAFYETPVGQKLSKTFPHFQETEASSWAKYIGPKVETVLNLMTNENQELPPPPGKRPKS